jgi:hypothetical protein
MLRVKRSKNNKKFYEAPRATWTRSVCEGSTKFNLGTISEGRHRNTYQTNQIQYWKHKEKICFFTHISLYCGSNVLVLMSLWSRRISEEEKRVCVTQIITSASLSLALQESQGKTLLHHPYQRPNIRWQNIFRKKTQFVVQVHGRPIWFILFSTNDRLCGLVVRVPDYRPRGPGSIPGATSFSEE